MTALVVGASGATGRLLVEQLLARGESVRIIVRSPARLPEELQKHERLTVIQASLLDLTDAALAQHVAGCDAVLSCLGHNMTMQGMFGQPRKLVTDAVRRLCRAVQANGPQRPVRFVLMNTAGNSNRDLDEPISLAQKSVVGTLRLILPPHADNENAADYLRTEIGQADSAIEWVVVRPDNLLDEEEVTPYELHASPIRSAIFNAGVTSRINVGHFMAALATDDALWAQWQGQMPVIYNEE